MTSTLILRGVYALDGSALVVTGQPAVPSGDGLTAGFYTGAPGGTYGAGGGGSPNSTTAGAGEPGVILIIYTPKPTIHGRALLMGVGN